MAGAALREERNDAPQARSAAPSWGRSTGSGASWGRSSATRSTDASAWPSWGQLALNENQNQSTKGQESDSSYTSGNTNLLPHELRARAVLAESQKRQVTIHAGPGPESNRAGRLLPRSEAERLHPRNKAERLAIAQSALAKKKAQEIVAQKTAAAEGGPPLIRKTFDSKHILGDIEQSSSGPAANEELRGAPLWTHLKRRGVAENVSTPVSRKPQSSEDPFAAARAKREEEARSGQYTPLGNRNMSRPSEKRRDAPHWGAQFRLQDGETTIRGSPTLEGELQSQTLRTPLREKASESQDTETVRTTATWRPLKPQDAQTASEEHESSQTLMSAESSHITPAGRGIRRPPLKEKVAADTTPYFEGFVRNADKSRYRGRLVPSEAVRRIPLGDNAPVDKTSYGELYPSSAGRSSPADRFEREHTTDKTALINSNTRFRISRAVSVKDSSDVEQIYKPVEHHERNVSVDHGERNVIDERITRQERNVTEEGNLRAEREDRSQKVSARFATAKPSLDDIPKGKGRDKARRRQQFLEPDEENEDDLGEIRRRKELRLQRKKEKEARKAAAPLPILLPEYITVSNLAMALKVRVETFVDKLKELGYEETSTDHILNAEDSGLIALEYNYEAIIDRSESEDLKAREPATDPTLLPPRPPVVTIMGHVDHGKTTLLDWLRKSSVAATEHGGITQHIGAFSVQMPSGKIITFLDTPGHAAFLSMRQRGANVTDIVVLVVAADDSVKPQTIEAINHAKAAKVPIIVAVNKIDKEEANVDRVKQDLARHGVDVEDYGGDTQVVCVSGKTGQGMGELEEAVVTLSEILDMRAETNGQAEGWVLEASIKSMGKVATVLVRRGTVRPGDFIVAGKTWARIRCLRNEAGIEIESAGPGTPVEIDGWREQPLAGDEVLQAPDEAKAKSVIEYRLEKAERDKMAEDMEAINEARKAEQLKREREKQEARLAAEAEAAHREYVPESGEAKPKGPKEVYFIVKGDVSGSVEAVIDSISVLGNKEVQPRILRSGVGQLAEFDIEHAAAAKGHVINFNTPLDPHISQLAERNNVTIIDQNIIYRLVDDVRTELSKHLPPLITQRVLGEAEIAQIFSITVKGRQQKNIAGCKIRNGSIFRNAKVRVLRNDEKVFEGKFKHTRDSLTHL